LGLRSADERTIPDAILDRWGQVAADWIPLDAVMELARGAGIPARAAVPVDEEPLPRPCRLGIAWDDAFHFYYEDNLRRLEALGATLVRFSPIGDRTIPDVDGLYLGGGYPEVHAEALAANDSMRASLRAFAEAGGPVYAECGGLMYLARAIRTLDGRSHAMVGLFGVEAVMKAKLVALGYVEVETQSPTLLGPAGLHFRGHQFRYSELVPEAGGTPPAAYSVRRRRGDVPSIEGYQTAGVLGSYVHAHWASNPLAARGLVESCARFAVRRRG
jgi:cobyrinic acid a,c-diamide synthase